MKKEDLKKEIVKYFNCEETSFTDSEMDILGMFTEKWEKIIYGDTPDNEIEYQIEDLLDEICCYF